MAKTYSGDKIVITNKEVGSLFPMNREEVSKELLIDGNDKPFEIHGGVFSSNISIKGSGIIKGPIFTKGDLHIDPGKEPVIIQSGVTALHSLIIEETTKSKIEDKLCSSIDNLRVLIKGDVHSDRKVILNDTVVLGSITAPDIVLYNSFVLGAIFDAKHVEVKNSNLGIYITESISFEGTIGFFITGGKSTECPELVKSNELDSIVRYIPLCRLKGYGCGMDASSFENTNEDEIGVCCSLWANRNCPYSDNINIERTDFAQIEIKSDNSWYLGLQSRSLTMSKIIDLNNEYKRMIHSLFAYEHLANKDKEDEIELWKNLSSSENKIFKMALR